MKCVFVFAVTKALTEGTSESDPDRIWRGHSVAKNRYTDRLRNNRLVCLIPTVLPTSNYQRHNGQE